MEKLLRWLRSLWRSVCRRDKVMYIGGSDTLPPPLPRDQEAVLLEKLNSGDFQVRQTLIERNLRLVVYIARRFENTGIHIEDQVCPKRCGALGGVQVVTREESAARIELALKSRRSDDFFIIARTDSKGAIGFDEAIERGRIYAAAGADAIMIEGLDNLDEIKRVVDSIDAPILFNIFERSKEEAYNVRELEALGVKIIINCLTSTMYSAAVLKHMMETFKETGTTESFVDGMLSMKEYTHILGIEREMEILS